jgi:hypothetical protein
MTPFQKEIMVNKLTDEELIQLVAKLMKVEGTEEENDEWLGSLKDNLPYAPISDLIFWPSRYGLPNNLTPKQIVDIALSYKPNVIHLGPPKGNPDPHGKN